MCGFVGVVQIEEDPLDPVVLRRMTDVQRHRGPDDQGFALFSLGRGEARAFDRSAIDGAPRTFSGGLGFNRLSILDLSANGHQPMASEDGKVQIVFNGEIYNAFDHRPDLEASGFHFRSRTDTEVILYLYEKHGLDGALARLNGMFAICLVDLRRRSLVLARDRLGIKPLYWTHTGGALLFSSEIKSFLEHPSFRAELDPDRLDEHFAFRYCAGDRTILRGVRQLEPGCVLTLRNGEPVVRRYWTPPANEPGVHVPMREAVDRVEELLQESVKRQLQSDVRVGCQLSGGIDSSLVNLFAAREAGGRMEAFSVVFDDARLSEEPWVDEAAQRAGVRSHKFTLAGDYVLDHLARTTWHLDLPLNHPNSVGIYFLSESARPFVTVLLSGEGADELFGGYIRFLYARLQPLLRAAWPCASRLPVLGRQVRRRFDGLAGSDPVEWFIRDSFFQSLDGLRALRPGGRFDRMIAERRGVFEEGGGDYLSSCFRYELRTFLVDLLVRQDKMTMAHSMENRVPFLDHELVEYVQRLPRELLVRARPTLGRFRMRTTKVLLKALARRSFPDRFVFRPKSGFRLPLSTIFGTPVFRQWMCDELLPSIRARGVVEPDAVERGWRAAQAGDAREAESVWTSVAFEVWASQFLDGRRPASEPVRAPKRADGPSAG